MRPPTQSKMHLYPRIKIMARLDIAERRLPPGRTHTAQVERTRDGFPRFRASSPFRRKDSLRLLDKAGLQLDMTKLGFRRSPIQRFQGRHLPALRNGAALRGRPEAEKLRRSTAHCRTSTKSATISPLLKTPSNTISRESTGPGARGNRPFFRRSLRSFLRQDPDIIMVGEIRDFETAEIAVKAALTGAPRI